MGGRVADSLADRDRCRDSAGDDGEPGEDRGDDPDEAVTASGTRGGSLGLLHLFRLPHADETEEQETRTEREEDEREDRGGRAAQDQGGDGGRDAAEPADDERPLLHPGASSPIEHRSGERLRGRLVERLVAVAAFRRLHARRAAARARAVARSVERRARASGPPCGTRARRSRRRPGSRRRRRSSQSPVSGCSGVDTPPTSQRSQVATSGSRPIAACSAAWTAPGELARRPPARSIDGSGMVHHTALVSQVLRRQRRAGSRRRLVGRDELLHVARRPGS